ncbi:MAG TPA: bifunctional phosphoribosyl-AMP cyclohydrolase/phosphoribosyl-ATP diphosphatase HisIE [Steroidobacteraceae bacterium]|jgi:phosphoribosyl-ATP pyrophosphohydrolase/phosphoribosyl-AMP cyclohydrolase|nr:bifunctional phosphoribosyl-AMP cyclohydrolase/phosphoribosyl-ATP diphosphatase HisIE [Steroidobacteraceae bacterium]
MTTRSERGIGAADVSSLDFAKGDGLLPAVVQDADTGAVLMLGYMNRDALRTTFERGRVVFFSRSKQRLWEKGETSGNTLDLVEVRTDCDRDTLLVTARPRGPACHTGTATCFGDEKPSQAERLAFLGALEGVIEKRIADRPEGSYTARLYAQGAKRIAQKVGEEGLEVALAAVAEPDEKVIAESADLIFHLLVLLKSRGVSLERVARELEARHTEKKTG